MFLSFNLESRFVFNKKTSWNQYLENIFWREININVYFRNKSIISEAKIPLWQATQFPLTDCMNIVYIFSAINPSEVLLIIYVITVLTFLWTSEFGGERGPLCHGAGGRADVCRDWFWPGLGFLVHNIRTHWAERTSTRSPDGGEP